MKIDQISENSYFSKLIHSEREYKVILYLQDSDWRKPILLGCDSFKQLAAKSRTSAIQLIKDLMKENDHVKAFQLIANFIQQHSTIEMSSDLKSDLNLLEEIREIGFDKVLDTNDEFTKFRLRLANESATMTLKIVGNQQFEYSLDAFKEAPSKRVVDSDKGFLKRILKLAANDYKELMGISENVFMAIDEQFSTLQPERFDKGLLRRSIHDGDVLVYFDYESKEFVMQRDGDNFRTNMAEALMNQLSTTLTINEPDKSAKECGICYSNYLDGHLADLECPDPANTGCKQVYHVNCLREWFRANPTSRTVFEKICGSCLFCDQEMFINNKNN